MVQTGEWFEFTVENALDTEVRFVVLTLNYGRRNRFANISAS